LGRFKDSLLPDYNFKNDCPHELLSLRIREDRSDRITSASRPNPLSLLVLSSSHVKSIEMPCVLQITIRRKY
jgi:hypothetical protein